jgi:hypothetical protein
MPKTTISPDAKMAALKELDEIFDPLINQVALFVGRLESAGQNPAHYFDVEENAHVDYIAILKQRQDAKAQAVQQVMAEFDRLAAEDAPVPEGGDADTTFWKAVILIAQQVLKDGIRIKIGDFKWDSKKPLHGLNSVLSEVKDAVLKAIGVDPNSEWGKVLNNPGRAVGDLPENAKREVERALENVKRETDKALADAAKAAGRVIADSKREVDRAATNVAREAGKVLKVKIKKPRWL